MASMRCGLVAALVLWATEVTVVGAASYGQLRPGQNGRLFNGVYFTYEGKTSRESDLPQCPSTTSVCSLVHQRFWLPVLSQRLCRCRDDPCPFQWNATDRQTILLNSRIQMKFCNPRNDLRVCGLEPAPAATMQQMKASSTLDLLEERPDVTVNCTCPSPSVHVPVGTRRERDGSRVTTFACRMLKPCKNSEPCGAIRMDTYSTYHTCGCPPGQLCLFKEVNRRKEKRNVDLLFYRAPAYLGQCRALRR